MGLFKPVWQEMNESKALSAIAKETDEDKLARIARSAFLPSARKAAMKKVGNNALLADIAKSVADPYERWDIIVRIFEEGPLRELQEAEQDFYVKKTIARQLIRVRYRKLAEEDNADELASILDEIKANGFQHDGRDASGRGNGLHDIWCDALKRLIALRPNRRFVSECRIIIVYPRNSYPIKDDTYLYPADEREAAFMMICAGLIGSPYQNMMEGSVASTYSMLTDDVLKSYVKRYIKDYYLRLLKDC